MKRLIVCCDGTWNKPESENVTNIERIARSVETRPDRSGGVQQSVLYLSGVGTRWYWFDRVLGGAFGFGLFANVIAGYRFLALNYEPGDEIFIFGFSRGAFTARSIGGMIGCVGLLTGDALIQDKLPEAVDRYREQTNSGLKWGSSNAEFIRDNCHTPTIDFLGVFDTVGALGVPGALRKNHTFHDVKLSDAIGQARQALAIDERRLKFEPAMWEAEERLMPSDDRVKQVWFEGAHSDTGGGYAETGLSDTALFWMTSEATKRGLVFDHQRLSHYTHSGSSPVRHDSMNLGYRVLNMIGRLRNWLGNNPRFKGTTRIFDPKGAVNPRIASSALNHHSDDKTYDAPNINWFTEKHKDDVAAVTEPVIALPERDVSVGGPSPIGSHTPDQII